MIIAIEGSRHVGKTFLLEEFFKRNQNPNILYYKFQFANHIEELGIRDQETGPGVHYFSISNILTILELNRTVFKDKLLVFDRSLLTAYVWSIYRERMNKDRLIREYGKILNSDLYRDYSILYLTRSGSTELKARDKNDYFGNFEDYSAESAIFEEIMSLYRNELSYRHKNNTLYSLHNQFTPESVDNFELILNEVASKI